MKQDASYSDTSGDRREVHRGRPDRRDRHFLARVCSLVQDCGRYWGWDHFPDRDLCRSLERGLVHLFMPGAPRGLPAEGPAPPDYRVPVSRGRLAADRSDGRVHSFPDGGVPD